ncbi:uncharacterized protein E0L32_003010 [Thyridium curvatum]|uniref:Cytochrome P450 n=1 Tax=Thyridium curvatum TaxID=1093900 RepID=A0A507BKD5_9PEZI|nr:uncharacterized protein E0L32_003010 [Thyridium curvatum]TPX17909.1 hypothetical protein E0L32_003010 [Thyridium curvatum]
MCIPAIEDIQHFLGHFTGLISDLIAFRFAKWAKEYGPIFSLTVGPTNIVVLCDRRAAHKLLVEKGNIYSERPHNHVADLLSSGEQISFGSLTPAWREKRKIVSHNFSPKRLDEDHFKVQEAEKTVLMTNLLHHPETFYQEIRRYTASVVTSITFGYRAPTYDSFWGRTVYDFMDEWTVCLEPGVNPPVDEFPILQYLPTPLAAWKRRALAARDHTYEFLSEARDRVEKRRAKGEKRDCIMDRLLDESEKQGRPAALTERGFINAMGEVVEGGADTTASQLLTLILALTLYPEVQERARREIDAVCGTQRSPRWDDFSSLPYINCIVKEGMRWRPKQVCPSNHSCVPYIANPSGGRSTPVGFPHRVTQDDEYEGMFIPKDSIVFLPSLVINYDQDFYKDPDSFKPERYLSHPKLANDYAGSPDWANRDHYSYGIGRRICPGIHLAERNQWRIAANLLWAFEFSEPVNPETGEIEHLDPEAYTPGLLQTPLPFKVQIKVRSQAHAETIQREYAEALDFMKQYE